MTRWSTRGAALAAVAAGWLWLVNGCGGGSAVGTESSESPASSASAGNPGVMSVAGSSASAATSTQAGSGSQAQPTQPNGAGTGGASTAGAAGSAAGSGGSRASAPAGEPTFSAIYTEILTKGATGNCMFAACHGGEPDANVNGGLQIKAGDKAGAYKNLVGAQSTGLVCTGKTYVIPGDSAGSLLIQKFADAPPCGAKMPIGSPLTAAQIAQVAKWIDDGAKDN